MFGSSDDEGLNGSRAASCAGCGAAFAAEQRYCMECGARRDALPAAIVNRIDAMQERKRRELATARDTPADAGAGDDEAAEADPAEETSPVSRYMPTPRAAAVAVLGLLAFGVVIGTATSPLAQSAGVTAILLEASPPASPSEPVEAEAPARAPESAAPDPQAEAASLAPESPSSFEEAEPEVSPPPTGPPPLPPEPELPPVKHVFLIVLGAHGYEEAFGESSTAPYLAKTLRAQGELLTNYYAATQGDLANEIALVSGQGPTLETAANCPNYTDISPATLSVEEEQVEGSGCVYPAETQTLPGQFSAQGLAWRAYVEGIGVAGAPATCRHPALGGPDPDQAPGPGDAYETWRNPFVYFHSLTDGAECAESDVGLERLAPDLKTADKTPAFSYIVPDACHDGSELPCEPGQSAGLAAIEPFLQAVVPKIKTSPAYKEGGLIAITFAQAPQTGPSADPSACCATPEYPNLPLAPTPETTEATTPTAGSIKPTGGGGRVGLLLISPFVKPGSVNETGYYNHFSLLLSIESLFELQPIGYAANPALTAFDGSVYNAATQASTGSAAP